MISSRHNVTVNGRHPDIIQYTWMESDTERVGTMTTFDTPPGLAVGSSVNILYRGSDSMIVGLKPASLPAKIILIIAAVAGVFCLIGLICAWIFRPFWRRSRN